MWQIQGYDVPTDAKLAVDLAALGMLSLLLQLFGVSEASCLLVRLWQTLEVKFVNLDGHPTKRKWEMPLQLYISAYIISHRPTTDSTALTLGKTVM